MNTKVAVGCDVIIENPSTPIPMVTNMVAVAISCHHRPVFNQACLIHAPAASQEAPTRLVDSMMAMTAVQNCISRRLRFNAMKKKRKGPRKKLREYVIHL